MVVDNWRLHVVVIVVSIAFFLVMLAVKHGWW